ncbi:DUF4374 domain-containing protein [Larkinella terrae]|uniref:DUF4374 domain-containing protein n=1 Tax=Larkinella terrae TaxID=2025311 RepID=A0A7K0EM33_9BACT|nr:DUF4374 domain-containing protein [Larkinella terrae]MRS62897.1 DUF4374 domain-containing protein [Larkinella terrae]
MYNKSLLVIAAFGCWASLSSCSKDKDPGTTDPPVTVGGYVVAIRDVGATKSTDYLLQTTAVSSGTLSVAGKGIEQTGNRSYIQAGKTIFSIGGSGTNQGSPSAVAYGLDASNKLVQKGNFTFDKYFDVLTAIDDNTIGGVQIPRTAAENRGAIFYTATASALTAQVKNSLAPLYKDDQVWPSGMRVRDGKAYVSYYLQNRTDLLTPNTDTAYVAIYTYPAFALEKVIKDVRTGPAGSSNSSSGLIKTENGDIYTVSSSGYTFSQRTKPAGILRIKNGETVFDPSYFFNLDEISNNRKIYFSQYLGNGLVLAEMGRFPTVGGQWAFEDVNLSAVIIDLNAKTIKDVTGGIPAHAGQGGIMLSVLVENGKAYLPVTSYTDGTYIWEIDIATATAKQAAKVDAKYVTGIFKL